LTDRRAAADEVFGIIADTVRSYPYFAGRGMHEYPMDCTVQCPSTSAVVAENGLSGVEMMWVRVVAVGKEPDHWIACFLNTPRLSDLKKDEYITCRAAADGLRFAVRVKWPQ